MNPLSQENIRKRKPKDPCHVCGINSQFCICVDFKTIDTKTRVDLIVHHKELKRTSNTGRLIQILLKNQKIWIRGEIDQPLDHLQILNPDYSPVLLFPSEAATVASAESLTTLAQGKPLQILVPDGNWRQASKVHYRVKELKAIPRVTLPSRLADRDGLLRKETKDDGMSTIEALAHLLGFIEGVKVKEHLLAAYSLKKKTQLSFRGVKA